MSPRPLDRILDEAPTESVPTQGLKDADPLDLGPPAAAIGQVRKEAELEHPDDAGAVRGDQELVVRVTVDTFERRPVCVREGVRRVLATSAQRIVSEHGNEGRDVVPGGLADRDPQSLDSTYAFRATALFISSFSAAKTKVTVPVRTWLTRSLTASA